MMGILLMPIMLVICWQLEKAQLFITIEERFKHHPTVTLKIQLEKVTWIKKNREILFNGSMFDVRSIIYDKEYAILTGHFDEEENEINKQISKQTNPGQENKTAKFFDHYLKIFNAVSKPHFYSYTFQQVDTMEVWNMQKAKKPSSIPLNVATPPPNQPAFD